MILRHIFSHNRFFLSSVINADYIDHLYIQVNGSLLLQFQDLEIKNVGSKGKYISLVGVWISD